MLRFMDQRTTTMGNARCPTCGFDRCPGCGAAQPHGVVESGDGDASAAGSLDDLATEIASEIDGAERDARSAVAHARRAGELLIRAKDQVPYGEWQSWLDRHVGASRRRTAQTY